MMVAGQILIWVLFSLAAGIFTYYILTEGKSNFLLVLSIFFCLFFGLSTSYIWLQTTNGLAAYSWGLFVLPVLLTFIAEVVLLSFYMYYHKNKVMPRVPKFTRSNTVSFISIAIIFILAFFLASAYQVPVDVQPASVSVLGSDQIETIQPNGIETESDEIMIQTSVVSTMILRESAIEGDMLNFKVEFMPRQYYVQPSIELYIEDSQGNLMSESNILLLKTDNNVIEGKIICDTPGKYTINVYVYDVGIGTTTPLVYGSHSFTVQDGSFADVVPNTPLLLFMFIFFTLLGFIACVIGFKKYK